MVKSTVNTISNANTNTAGSSATKGATSPAVSCARNNSSNMVALREWYDDRAKYCNDKYQGFNSSLTWDDKTNTATVFMSGNGSVNYVNIKPGKDGSYIKDGKLYVDQAVLMKNLGPAIDPAAKKIHDVDALIIGTAIGAKGISSGINIIKGISATDAAGSAAAVEGGRKTINTLTDAQKSRLNSLKNTINDHLTEGDFSGTLRDLQGKPVPNGKGGYFDHLGEMKNSYTALNKIKNGLEGSLKNPTLSDIDRTLLQEGLDNANSYIYRIQDMFKPFGGIK